jgi:Xaa-Pro aminopeptidase
MHQDEFAGRRRKFMDIIGKGGMAILPAAPVVYRNRDVEHPYRQDSNFYYLTGFPEPEALLVLIPGRAQGEYILFCREKDQEKETWHGQRAGLEGAVGEYGADDAFPITDIDEIVPGLMESCRRLYYPMGCYAEFDQKVMEWLNELRGKIRQGVHVPDEIVTLDRALHELRIIKSEAEIAKIRKAVEIAIQAHHRVIRHCRPKVWEYQLQAELYHEFIRHNARFPSYPAIIGSGPHTCTLHYIENTRQIQDGDLVLLDAGAEYDYYASDITRTFPANGRFSEAQKAIYELVLRAQYAALEKIRPGNLWIEPQQAAVRTITEGLLELGLLQGELDKLIEEEKYKRFYMHRIGHWLGMDVHDVGEFKINEEWRPFEPGMVLTVEPGIYIAPGADVAEKWWHIGIRIEDDVLVTESGYEVLSAAMPKSVAEIEALMVRPGE